MKKLFRKKRAVSSIISTLIIFSIMVSALALAFSQIVPSLEIFQTESDITTAKNTFMDFDYSIQNLVSSPVNSSSTLRYTLTNGILDITTSRHLDIIILSGTSSILEYSTVQTETVYSFSGNFKGQGGVVYYIGTPQLLVYSINRTNSLTNIVQQTFDDQKLVRLYYDIFVTIKPITSTLLEIDFLFLNFTTQKNELGLSEYFPVINKECKIQITKTSFIRESYNFESNNGLLEIKAMTSTFSQSLTYALTPSIPYDLIINFMSIEIDFKTI